MVLWYWNHCLNNTTKVLLPRPEIRPFLVPNSFDEPLLDLCWSQVEPQWIQWNPATIQHHPTTKAVLQADHLSISRSKLSECPGIITRPQKIGKTRRPDRSPVITNSWCRWMSLDVLLGWLWDEALHCPEPLGYFRDGYALPWHSCQGLMGPWHQHVWLPCCVDSQKPSQERNEALQPLRPAEQYVRLSKGFQSTSVRLVAENK